MKQNKLGRERSQSCTFTCSTRNDFRKTVLGEKKKLKIQSYYQSTKDCNSWYGINGENIGRFVQPNVDTMNHQSGCQREEDTLETAGGNLENRCNI